MHIFADVAASGLSVPELLAILVPLASAAAGSIVYVVRSKDEALLRKDTEHAGAITKMSADHRAERDSWREGDKAKDERFERFVLSQSEAFERWRESIGGLFSHTARAAEAAQQAVELLASPSTPPSMASPPPDRRSEEPNPPTRGRRISRA